MAFNITEIRNALKDGGARPSLFQITIPALGGGNQISFLAKSANIPAATTAAARVNYFGREIKLGGDSRSFEPWTIQVINDEGFVTRKVLENWVNAVSTGNWLDAFIRKSEGTGTAPGAGYYTDITVTQYKKDGSAGPKYKMINAFPTGVDAIQLSWDQKDAIEEYGVTFEFDYWQPA